MDPHNYVIVQMGDQDPAESQVRFHHYKMKLFNYPSFFTFERTFFPIKLKLILLNFYFKLKKTTLIYLIELAQVKIFHCTEALLVCLSSLLNT